MPNQCHDAALPCSTGHTRLIQTQSLWQEYAVHYHLQFASFVCAACAVLVARAGLRFPAGSSTTFTTTMNLPVVTTAATMLLMSLVICLPAMSRANVEEPSSSAREGATTASAVLAAISPTQVTNFSQFLPDIELRDPASLPCARPEPFVYKKLRPTMANITKSASSGAVIIKLRHDPMPGVTPEMLECRSRRVNYSCRAIANASSTPLTLAHTCKHIPGLTAHQGGCMTHALSPPSSPALSPVPNCPANTQGCGVIWTSPFPTRAAQTAPSAGSCSCSCTQVTMWG